MHPVPPCDVKQHWHRVRKVLDAMAKRHSVDGWLPEDVYVALVSGQATLYVQDGVDGFAILQLLPRYTGKRLHVWIAYCKEEPSKYINRIKEIAKAAGASVVTFESSRKGWLAKAARYGFRQTAMVYEMEV